MNPAPHRLVLALSLVASCGASSAEVKQAKSASYTCSASEILAIGSEVLADRVAPLAGVDPDRRIAVTKFRWHEPSGRRKAVESDYAKPGDVFVSVTLVVKAYEFGRFQFALASEVHGQIEGSPQAVPLPPGNAARPRWVAGREDELQVAIHKALSRCAHLAET